MCCYVIMTELELLDHLQSTVNHQVVSKPVPSYFWQHLLQHDMEYEINVKV